MKMICDNSNACNQRNCIHRIPHDRQQNCNVSCNFNPDAINMWHCVPITDLRKAKLIKITKDKT